MAIQFQSLTKYYRPGTAALLDLTLEIAPGTVFALMGRNGAGKTTTIQLLMDLLLPTSGESRIFGVASAKLRPEHRQRIGYVSENQKLPDWMQIGQFLHFLRPMYPAWDSLLTTRLTKLFALPMGQRIDQLSRGQRMKVAFLGALCYRPEVLVLDEPFSGLDSVIRQDLLDALIEYLGDGSRTVLLSSHDLEEVERLADTIGILEQGRIGLQGSIDDLLGRAREVSFTSNIAPPPAELLPGWWNVNAGHHGVAFTATGVASDQALAGEIRRRWPDVDCLRIRPAGFSRFYTDYLRHAEAQAVQDHSSTLTPTL